jgi:hypothetical protein
MAGPSERGRPEERLDHGPHVFDVALPSTLGLQHSAGPQRPRKSRPQAILVAHTMQGCRRDDRVDRSIELEIQHVLTPDLGAIAEPRAPARPSPTCVQCEHATPREEREERLRDAPGPAADIQHRRVRRDARDAGQYLGRPAC